MSAAISWTKENWELIAGVLYAILNLANGLTKSAEAHSLLGKAIDALSILTRADASGTVKLPLAKSKKSMKNGVH